MERHIWDELDWAWHALFGLFAAVTGALLIADDRSAAGPIVLLVVVLCWYAATGAWALGRPAPDRLGVAYLVMATPLIVALYASTPIGAILLFLLFPQFWRLLPTGWAVTATVLTIAAIATLQLTSTAPADVPALLGWLAAMLVVAVLLGLWITKITE